MPSTPAGYPAFSATEFAARHESIGALARAHDLTHVLVYGANKSGSGIQWLTNWPVTREAALLWSVDGEHSPLYVQYPNHAPMAREVSIGVEVAWGGPSTFACLADELRTRGVRRVGLIGSLPHRGYLRLLDELDEIVELNRPYTDLRLIKSDEETEWMRRGARMSDDAVLALEAEVRPGMTDYDLANIAERAYVPSGGTTQLHFFGVTSMAAPDRPAPLQFQSGRQIDAGDAISMEISAAWWGHPGQVLRTFAVAADPTPLYAELHAVADAAFDAITAALRPGATAADLVDASGVIEDAGYTICDDLVHGYGGGYLPPVLGSRSRPAGEIPELVFAEGMMMVIQPNVVTPDLRAGVQTGELVRVTADGWESLHTAPRGFRRVA